jgi:hypothetical protein
MASIFKDALLDGLAKGYVPNKTQQARNWFRTNALNTTATSNQVYQRADMADFRSRVEPGNMYFYYYDPKWKEKLPDYDIFPCTLVYKMTPDGWYGLNFHYLNHMARAQLLDALYEQVTDTRYDAKTKIAVTYEILQRTWKLRWYRHCIKRYLSNHVRSRFIYVPPSDWDTALFLPVENFKNGNLAVLNRDRLGVRGRFLNR